MTLKVTHDWTHSLNNDKVENKKLQNHTKTQPINEKTPSIKRHASQKNQELLSQFLSLLIPPPPSRRIRGTFAPSPSPEPPYLGEKYTPYLDNW